jgi:hypothetical protein
MTNTQPTKGRGGHIQNAKNILYLSDKIEELENFYDQINPSSPHALQFPKSWFINLYYKYFGVVNNRSSAYQNDHHSTVMDNNLRKYIAQAYKKRIRELKIELKIITKSS